MSTAALKLLCVAVTITAAVAITWAYRNPPAYRAPRAQFHAPPAPESSAAAHRARVKGQLARQLVAQRVPLLYAVEQFRLANDEDGLAVLTVGMRGRSVREKLCRQVISYARVAEAEMRDQGHLPSSSRVAEEWQAEFDCRLGAGEFPPEPGVE